MFHCFSAVFRSILLGDDVILRVPQPRFGTTVQSTNDDSDDRKSPHSSLNKQMLIVVSPQVATCSRVHVLSVHTATLQHVRTYYGQYVYTIISTFST